MQAIAEIKRPALRYYGGKWRLAPWVISYFPEHKNYVEPCGGAASVLLQKPRSELETYNDIDGNVTNYFRVLRDAPERLAQQVKLTPWSRDEYELSFQPCEDPVEQARRFWCLISMSVNASREAPGFRLVTEEPGKLPELNKEQVIENFFRVAARLQGVQIENREALDIIRRFDNNEALIYFDPPYIAETRAQSKRYRYEVDHEFHVQAAVLLRQSQGFVIISGYQHPLYSELYEMFGWERIDKEVQTNSGGKRVESLWLSPRIMEWRQNNRLHLTGKGGGQIQLFN
jgi:DNA adenine methylase